MGVGREKGEGRVVWSITTKLAKKLDLNGGGFKRVGIGWKKKRGRAVHYCCDSGGCSCYCSCCGP